MKNSILFASVEMERERKKKRPNIKTRKQEIRRLVLDSLDRQDSSVKGRLHEAQERRSRREHQQAK